MEVTKPPAPSHAITSLRRFHTHDQKQRDQKQRCLSMGVYKSPHPQKQFTVYFCIYHLPPIKMSPHSTEMYHEGPHASSSSARRWTNRRAGHHQCSPFSTSSPSKALPFSTHLQHTHTNNPHPLECTRHCMPLLQPWRDDQWWWPVNRSQCCRCCRLSRSCSRRAPAATPARICCPSLLQARCTATFPTPRSPDPAQRAPGAHCSTVPGGCPCSSVVTCAEGAPSRRAWCCGVVGRIWGEGADAAELRKSRDGHRLCHQIAV
eukprot:1151556-Pelagomonas_calceolata.AAC.1